MVRYCLNIFAIAALLILNSCSKEKSLVKEGVALQISPAIGEITKSLVDDLNISAKEIGIQITNQAGTQLYDGNGVYANMRLFKPAGSWVFDNGAGLPREVTVNGENAKIYAYYPFTSNPASFVGTGETSVLMVNIPKEHKKDSIPDYLWCAQDKTPPSGGSAINSNNASVQLKMNHSLSMIAFVFYKSGYEQTGNITRMEIKSTSGSNIFRVNKEGINDLRMKLSNGEIVGGSAASSLTITNINSNITLSSDPGIIPATLFSQRNFHMLLVPATVANRDDIEFSFEIDGSIFTAKFPGTGELNLTSGNAYILTVKLSPKSLNITGVAEWNLVSYEVSSGYDDLWYGMQPVQIGSLLWAPVNVGYDPANNPYGLMFQWHRKYGQMFGTLNVVNGPVLLALGNDVANSTKFYKNETSPFNWCTTYESSWNMSEQYNPCPQGWRIPTLSEFSSLRSGGSTWVNAGEGGMNNVVGRWYGGNHNTDRVGSVFLPAAGIISNQGNSGYRLSSQNGQYSTSEVSGNDIYRLRFTESINETSTINRAAGLSVRCVKSL
jgi:uncharacterized protein (TIGR02145 family)